MAQMRGKQIIHFTRHLLNRRWLTYLNLTVNHRPAGVDVVICGSVQTLKYAPKTKKIRKLVNLCFLPRPAQMRYVQPEDWASLAARANVKLPTGFTS